MFGRLAIAVSTLLLASCAHSVAADQVEATPVTPQQWAETCEPWDEWEKPSPPFNIHANTHYVGTCGIASILITSPQGHVLIDSGTRKGAEMVLDNVRALGFNPADIEILLMSHEHFDHVGGMAYLAKETGAKVVASPKAAPALRTGKDQADDPQFEMHPAMEPVSISQVIRDGQKVRLDHDKIVLTPIFTPGHTPGALSWRWISCAEKDCRVIVYADSLSPVSSDDYRFSDHPGYLMDYWNGLHGLRSLECEVLLTPHPSASKMLKRAVTGTFDGGMTCVEYADAVQKRLDERLAKEAAEE